MRKFRTCLTLLFLASLLLTATGCQIFEFLHPSKTWKLNRGPALDQGDAYFSVSDPLPEVE